MKDLAAELKFYKEQFAWWLRYEGLHMALLRSGARIIRVFGPDIRDQSWFPKEMESGFDRTAGVDTSGYVLKDQLDLDPARKDQSHPYMPTSAPQFRQVMAGLKINPSKFTFIDYGSGKGKTLMLASDHGFKSVIGVELSKTLHATAQDNMEKYQSANQGVLAPVCVNEDAVSHILPPSPTVLFFYNPFNRDVMKLVVEKIERSLAQNPRPFFAVYNNPVEKEVFDASNIFRLVRTDLNGRWLTYEFAGAPT